MKNKEIYAALEISDTEVRLVIGEFFESRFQVLRVERVNTLGVVEKRIVDEIAVSTAIRKAISKAQDSLGYEIKRVLLSIPSVDVEKHQRVVTQKIEDDVRRIRESHIEKALTSLQSYRPSQDLEFVNVSSIRYIVNDITSRTPPIGEVCDELTLKVDMQFANKDVVYSHLRCTELAGLDILDIYLDSYALAQEAAILTQTLDKFMIQVALEANTTTVALFYQGRLMSSELINSGYYNWLKDVVDRYGLSLQNIYRLLQNGMEWNESAVSDRVVYVWPVKNDQMQLTERELLQAVLPHIKEWIQNINEMSMPILEQGNAKYILSGSGFEMQSIEQLLFELNAPYQVYVPETIGVRLSQYTTTLGMFYSWKEMKDLYRDTRTSCDPEDVEDAIKKIRRISDDSDVGFTKRLKNMLLIDK